MKAKMSAWIIWAVLAIALAATTDFAFDITPFWNKAQEIVGAQGLPPPIVAFEIPPEIEGLKYEDILGYFYQDEYKIIITPTAFLREDTYWAQVMMHELMHAAMYKIGIPVEAHHCLMIRRNLLKKSLKWVVKKFHLPPDRAEEMSNQLGRYEAITYIFQCGGRGYE